MTGRRDWWPPALAALVCVAYLPSLPIPLLIVNELTIIGNGLQAVRDGWTGWFTWPIGYYRPLVFPLYTGLAAVGGLKGWPFHATLLLLHAGMTLWVYGLGRRLLDDRLAAGLGAAWFAVTWMKYENVVWGGGLESVAGAALAVLALWSGLSDRALWRSVSLVFFAAMLLVHQTLLLLPLVLWWAAWVRGGSWRSGAGRFLVGILLIAGWMIVNTMNAGPRAFAHTLPQVGSHSIVVWGTQVARNLGSLLGYVWAPWDGLGGPGAWLKYLSGLGSAVALVWLAWRGHPGERALAGGTLLTCGPILLRTLVEPRYGYLVSAGVCLLAAGRLTWWARASRKRVVLLGAVASVGILASAGSQWHKAGQYRRAADRVWEVLAQMKRDLPAWPRQGAVVEGLPLWEDRERMPVPLFGNDLAPTIWALYGDLDAKAWHDWESGIPPTALRIRFLDGRFVAQP